MVTTTSDAYMLGTAVGRRTCMVVVVGPHSGWSGNGQRSVSYRSQGRMTCIIGNTPTVWDE